MSALTQFSFIIDNNPEHQLKTMTTQPGVYQMFSDADALLYVGKARNLRNRVSSYFRSSGLSAKTQVLMSKVKRIELTVTGSENEALILENTLIKQGRPRYNILLRDDKSYPYLLLDTSHDYPRLDLFRGKRAPKGCLLYTSPSPRDS